MGGFWNVKKKGRRRRKKTPKDSEGGYRDVLPTSLSSHLDICGGGGWSSEIHFQMQEISKCNQNNRPLALNFKKTLIFYSPAGRKFWDPTPILRVMAWCGVVWGVPSPADTEQDLLRRRLMG